MTSAQTTKQLADQEQLGMSELRTLLRSQERFVRVHAAESLVEFGEPTEAYNTFLEEWNTHRDTPAYRVVVMRVLSHASPNEDERTQWMNRIRDVFFDKSQPDRLHASECLAKLKYPVPKSEVAVFEEAALSDNPSIAVFANWILATSEHGSRDAALFAYLKHSDPAGRYCSAYAFRHLQKVPEEVRQQLLNSAETEAVGALPRAYALSAAYVLAPDADARASLRDKLVDITVRGDKDEVREVCAAFASRGTASDAPVLLQLMKHDNADIREAAARAVVCIARRSK